MKTLLLITTLTTTLIAQQPPSDQAPKLPHAPAALTSATSSQKEVSKEDTITFLTLQINALESQLHNQTALVNYLQTVLKSNSDSNKAEESLKALAAKSGCDKLVIQGQDNPLPSCVSNPTAPAAK